jgi:hypothetical protein
MKEIARFQMGSSTFFHSLPGYEPKDLDELIIMDDWCLKENSARVMIGKNDTFIYRHLTKDGFICDALVSGVPMRLGKFLCPEFASFLKMDIKDLKRLEPLAKILDEKHTYEKIIYNAYIQNDGWWLTEEQRMAAYLEYKRTRNYI